jgi:ribosomal protein L37AE/L43A
MSIKYMCDRCEKEEGTHQIENGDWYCVGCYSSYADHVYEQIKGA